MIVVLPFSIILHFILLLSILLTSVLLWLAYAAARTSNVLDSFRFNRSIQGDY